MESKKCPSNLEELKKILEVDTLPGNQKVHEIILKLAQLKIQEKGDLDPEDKNSLLAQANKLTVFFSFGEDFTVKPAEFLSDEDLEKKAKNAKFNGFIPLWDLADILGAEENRDLLPILWKEFECNLSGREIETDMFNKRTDAWYKLLLRWVGIGSMPPDGGSDTYWADPILGKLPDMNYLDLYNRDPATGDLKIISIKNRDETGLIRLKDLEEWFRRIEQIRKIYLPFPKRLFLSQVEPSIVPEKPAETSSEQNQTVEPPTKEQYVFKKAGKNRREKVTWEIVYQGMKLPELEYKGLMYVQYYMKHPDDKLFNHEIAQVLEPGMPVETKRPNIDYKEDKNGEMKLDGYQVGGIDTVDTFQPVGDRKAFKQWLKEKVRLDSEIEKEDDPIVKKGLIEKREFYQKQIDEVIVPQKGKRKELEDLKPEEFQNVRFKGFEDQETKKIDERIRASMDELLKNLKGIKGPGTQEFADHLDKSFQPSYSSHKRKWYSPSSPIKWDFGDD